jgi:protease-4
LFVILFFLLTGSIFVNLVLLKIGNVGGGDSAQSTVISAGDSHKVIAVIPLEGLIDDALETRFERYMNWAKEDDNVKAAIILIDTPGGTVTASDEIYKRIKKFKSEKNIPVVVAMRGMATSGGYYAACAADHIIAERNTLTGNIGVIMPSYNFSKMLDKYGIDDSTIVATGATYKDAGSWTRAATPQHQAYLQSEIDASFEIFKQVVLDGRKNKLKGKTEDIFNGKAFMGAEALNLGLIDDIDDTGYLDAAIKYATQQASLSGPQVIKYHDPPVSLLNLLASSKSAGRQASNGGITINLDASLIDRLASRRAMYLYTGGR